MNTHEQHILRYITAQKTQLEEREEKRREEKTLI